jgi:hypothetical protein
VDAEPPGFWSYRYHEALHLRVSFANDFTALGSQPGKGSSMRGRTSTPARPVKAVGYSDDVSLF